MPSIDSLRASDGTENAAVATIQSVRSAGATTLVVDTVQGINDTFHGTMGTPHTFVDPVTSETITVISEDTAVDFKGHVDGTNLEIDEIAPGYTDNGSAADDIVIIKPTTQWADELADLLAVSMEDDGSLKAVVESPGWTETIYQPDTVTYNGNRSYDLVFNGVDLTSFLDNGMRLKFDRTVTPPTQCTDLELSSSQYWIKTSPTALGLTTTATVMGWVKLEAYGTGNGSTVFNTRAGSANDFTVFRINASGQIEFTATASSASLDSIISIPSIPLNKWVHIAASMTINSGGQVYIDGKPVSGTYTNGTTTAFGNTGNLAIGSRADTPADYVDGKVAQVAVFNAVLDAATIKSYASQTLAGNETNCVGLWTFDGDGDDSNANANNLTAQGSATATTTDSPFNATEYGIVTANSFSTNTTLTVQVPEGYAIPTSGGVSSMYYSTQDVPYGFPRSKNKWVVETIIRATRNTNSPSVSTWNNSSYELAIPVGDWRTEFNVYSYSTNEATAAQDLSIALSTSTSSLSDDDFQVKYATNALSTPGRNYTNNSKSKYLSLDAETSYYLIYMVETASMNAAAILGADLPGYIRAECAYV